MYMAALDLMSERAKVEKMEVEKPTNRDLRTPKMSFSVLAHIPQNVMATPHIPKDVYARMYVRDVCM